MIRVKWQLEEIVALVDLYKRTVCLDKAARVTEIEKLSILLNRRADVLGIKRDEKYRNITGITMMYENVRYVATNGEKGLSAANKLIYEVWDMSINNPELINQIYKQVLDKYNL